MIQTAKYISTYTNILVLEEEVSSTCDAICVLNASYVRSQLSPT